MELVSSAECLGKYLALFAIAVAIKAASKQPKQTSCRRRWLVREDSRACFPAVCFHFDVE